MWIVAASLAYAETDHFAGCDNTDAKWVELHNKAEQALHAGEPERALDSAMRAVKLQPTCNATLKYLAESLFRVGDPAVLQVAKRGATLFPEEPFYLSTLARASFAAQDFQGALAAAQASWALAPDNDAAESVVITYLRLGKYADAERFLASATGLAAADVACFRAKVAHDQHQDASAAWRECQQSESADLVENTRGWMGEGADELPINAALDLLRDSRYAEAEAALKALLDQEPWNALYRSAYASALVGGGKRAQARSQLDQLFGAKTWITIRGDGAMTGITTKNLELQLEQSLERSLATLVRLLLEDKSAADARTAYAKAVDRFGKTPLFAAAEIALVNAESGPAAAWRVASGAMRGNPGATGVFDEAAELVFADPAAAPADQLDAIVGGATEVGAYNAVAGLSNGERPECGRIAESALPRVQGETRAKVVKMGYACAVQADDLPRADVFLAAGGDALPADLRAWHADRLYRSGRKDDGVKLARALTTATAGEPAAVEVLAQDAEDRGDPDEMLRWAKHPSASPYARMNVAVALYNAGRKADAREIASTVACAEMKGDEARCREAVANLTK